jgi:hypothetical protein
MLHDIKQRDKVSGVFSQEKLGGACHEVLARSACDGSSDYVKANVQPDETRWTFSRDGEPEPSTRAADVNDRLAFERLRLRKFRAEPCSARQKFRTRGP